MSTTSGGEAGPVGDAAPVRDAAPVSDAGHGIEIRSGGLTSSPVQALLREHLSDMRGYSPADDVHALDLHGLQGHGIEFWTAWRDGELLGCCALQELDATHGEIKSMRTAGAQRRRGVAARMMHHLVDAATRRGYARLSLETGSADAFAPARSLYARFGFSPCSPFGQYVDSPHSVFMTRTLARGDTEQAGSPDEPLRPLASATPARPARA